MADEQQETKKNKKINRMNAAEVDSALKKTTEHMKGTKSKYAQELISRQAQLKKK